MVLNNKQYAVSFTLLICFSLKLLELGDAKPLVASFTNEWNNFKLLGNKSLEFPHSLRNKKLELRQQQQQQQVSVQAKVVPTKINYKQQKLNENQLDSLNKHYDEPTNTRGLLSFSFEQTHAINKKNTTSTTSRKTLTGVSLLKSILSLQNPRLLGGDILVNERDNEPKVNYRSLKYARSILLHPLSLWPDGVIFYELHPSVGHLTDLIMSVMQQFHDETCVRFMPRKQNEPDFIHIMAVTGCYSYIGRIGGEQNLSLSDGCEFRGTIAHELLHSVGFYHHQNRLDRDDFLEIIWENIDEDKRDQFDKIITQENMWLNEFDYNSIMLYGPHTFGRTLDKVTMKPKRDGVVLLEVAEKQGLSALDIDSVNRLYNCKPYDKITTD